jgi:hypothetical protein
MYCIVVFFGTPVQAELDAHDSPIQCLEYCAARNQAATCGTGAKVKVWSLARPSQPTLALVLDHGTPAAVAKQPQQQPEDGGAASSSSIGGQGTSSGAAEGAAASAAADVNPGGTSNMRWLIKSELAEGGGQGGKKRMSTLPDIVAEAIAHAAEDVPEAMQVGVGWVITVAIGRAVLCDLISKLMTGALPSAYLAETCVFYLLLGRRSMVLGTWTGPVELPPGDCCHQMCHTHWGCWRASNTVFREVPLLPIKTLLNGRS